VTKGRVLIIGTEVATNGFESGASIRLNGIRELLERCQMEVTVVARSESTDSLKKDWDLVVLVSFATARHLRKARKCSKLVWFDATDSWRLTRFSLMRSGDLKQIPILIRDLFWLWTAPKVDLLSFITRRDAEKEKSWWRKRSIPAIYPVQNLERSINPSEKIRLIFVGDGKYGPNVRAINFLRRVLDLLPKSSQIHIYGKGFENLDSRFVLHGYCASEKMYFERDIHLAPIESGAGLKLKVAVPLANGLKVISTPEGASGFSQNSNLLLATDEASFAAQVLRTSGTSKSNNRKILKDIFEEDDTLQIIAWINQSIQSVA
jgi:hypothetical protein